MLVEERLTSMLSISKMNRNYFKSTTRLKDKYFTT